ncbi:Zn-finger containing protein [Clostridium sp. CTA-7]
MRFFQGIYGIDLLSLMLLLLSSILNISHYTRIIGYAIFIIVIFRTFSRDIYKRQRELNSFVRFINKPLSKFGFTIPSNIPPIDLRYFSFALTILKNKINEKKNYKITKCPSCGQKLRLPRKKGKIVVTCKRCYNKFDFRT